jgi:Uma2 family endonuclease
MVALPAGFTPEDYLALEQNSSIRHEYRQGLVYAMAGSNDDHDEITLNLIEQLRTHLRNQPGKKHCEVRSGNVKVNYAENFFYYPDVFVTCDQRDQENRYIKRHPKLIVEVLSSSTGIFDRGDKFRDYQQIEALEEYVLIAQDQIAVWCFRRHQNWQEQKYQPGDRIFLESVGLEIPIEKLYEGVRV